MKKLIVTLVSVFALAMPATASALCPYAGHDWPQGARIHTPDGYHECMWWGGWKYYSNWGSCGSQSYECQ